MPSGRTPNFLMTGYGVYGCATSVGRQVQVQLCGYLTWKASRHGAEKAVSAKKKILPRESAGEWV